MKRSIQYLFICLLLSCCFLACSPFDDLVDEPTKQFLTTDEAELINLFAVLTGGDPSGCSIVRDIRDIPRTLCGIVEEARRGSEIVFLVDNTTSMFDDIDQVKANINEIIDCLPDGVRLGAATYSDRNTDDPWFTFSDLSDNYDIGRDFINAITLPETANADLPESVYDGIYEVLEVMSWQDCDAPDKIIVMGDAEPHTGPLTQYSAEDVLARSQAICRDTEFYPVSILEL